MPRIAIIGNSGSGKTTLAKSLLGVASSDILDLDSIAWEKNAPTTLRALEDAEVDVRTFCDAHSDWVVEGCYAGLIRATFDFNPQLIFLDPGVEVCLTYCKNRPWEPHKYSSKAEQDKHLKFLLEWVEAYYSRDGDLSHVEHIALYDAYSGSKCRQTKLD